MVSGIRKAAILLKSLPQPHVAAILARLEPKQAEAVATEVAALPAVDAEEQERVLREFDSTRRPGEAVPFSFLYGMDAKELAAMLTDEHPQTIALVLSYLPENQARAVLGHFPAGRQAMVSRRMATTGHPSPEIIRDVEEGLLQLR
jgi:flagellar motor switch protein FliG